MNEKQHDYRLLVVVTSLPSGGKQYRLPLNQDFKSLAKIEEILCNKSLDNYIPNENLPYLRSIFNVYVYGIRKWSDLFNSRQKIAIAILVKLVEKLSSVMDGEEPQLIEAVCTCIGLCVDRLADFNSNIARWANNRESSAATFGRQALGMVWDYCETVPISESTGSLAGSIEWMLRVCDSVALMHPPVGQVQQVSAALHSLPDDIASFIFTDPSYYDAVPYANLSDFFYVWLKRSIGLLHPDLLSESETPKRDEAVQLAERNPEYSYKTKKYFEDIMATSFGEGRRYTQPEGLGVIVFAHKATDAWETLLSALVKAGWTITASWPIDTEWGTRLRAQSLATLASSVHLVCRPRENPDGSLREEIGDWRDVLKELPQRIHEWMPRLAQEGVVGADAIFACLGPALEIFSRYSSVEKANGEEVTLREYLEYVWGAVSKEALGMIFDDVDTTGFEEDARLTAMWLWTLSTGEAESSSQEAEEKTGKVAKSTGYTLEFDAARKIAQGLGVHLDKLTNLVEIKGDKARLLPVSERGVILFGKADLNAPAGRKKKKKKEHQLDIFTVLNHEDSHEIFKWGDPGVPQVGKTVLDQVHQSMILFAAGRSEALKRFLVEDGIGNDQRYWKLAQALSALYPMGTDEKRWVDGVLARKKGLGF